MPIHNVTSPVRVATPRPRFRRRWGLLVALVFVLGACSGASDSDVTADASEVPGGTSDDAGDASEDDTASGDGATSEAEAEAPSDSIVMTGDFDLPGWVTTNEGDTPSWCGPDEITLALADGFGGNNWRRITSAEAEDEASKCPSVTEYLYADGQGDTQKSISDINGLVAQGVDALVIFADASEAMLPTIRGAYEAGVVTVPYRVFPGGEAGTDYHYFIDRDNCETDAQMWAEWMVEQLDGEGNVAILGGPPGNSQSGGRAECIREVLTDTNIEVVGNEPYEVTNWDPAETQRVITALLARYPQIDGWFTDFGAAFASSLPAFEQANREVAPVATEDSNAFACAAEEQGFDILTVSSQNWHSRLAVQFAVAEATGGDIPETTTNEDGNPVVEDFVFDDSVNGEIYCEPDLPADAILSSLLSTQEMVNVLE